MSASEPSWLSRHQITLFFVLTFVISWYPWWYGGHPGFKTWGPSLAGLIVVASVSGWRGVKEMFRRLVRWRVGLRWWGVALLGPVLLFAVVLGFYALVGGEMPGFTFLREEWHLAPLLMLLLLLPLGGPGGEEPFGWRGYALPVMQKKWGSKGPMLASLLIGAAWGVWHLPEFFNPVSSQYALGLGFLPAFIVMEIAWSIIMTWLYNKTGGSVLLGGVLFHLMMDVGAASMLTDFTLTGLFNGEQMPPVDMVLMWLMTAVTAIAAIVLTVVTKGRLGYAPEESS
jgi:membrane protease YdiL (CAAX protease family)